MAARRTRRSSGLTSLGIMDQDQEDHLAEFDSFRRRHARQNREIITENITRKGLIRSLQDQVSSLQADLLSARRQNAALTRQLACFRDDAAALDAIIEAVPKLESRAGPSEHDAKSLTAPQEPAQDELHAHEIAAHAGLEPTYTQPELTPHAGARHARDRVRDGVEPAELPVRAVPLSKRVHPVLLNGINPLVLNVRTTQPDTDPPSLASSSSSTTSTAALTSTSDAAIAAAPEDGRSRRARSSVSYKEPSLRTKMRKPDGVSSEEALGLRPRGSMLEGVRRKSALPRSTAKMDFRADKEEEGAPTPLAPAKVVKETLPKEGTKKAAGKRRAAATATTNAAGPAV
ncbi:uncharacterized protein CcaverHIS019_0107520 [Cutaneotrichosporon cavernicola]|uniref:Shugoshin C-terminal domain-containing protein n=1 Tax=Cutaneotrichosporon cavernicola TaxID=279322 RepID=A0AA48I1V5_9TREE|nr:uncharacterized protein CcaverHIS019_0107520 [Cutaneotrichosporon cavernicola]BEI88034.1 hypothetical protein CcaverHIS019_0107520 [Cutaneotrichosporon cavernicola]